MQGLRPRAQLFWRRVAIVGDDIIRDRQPACPRSLCRHDTPYGELRQPAARLRAGDLRGIAIDHADAVHAAASAAATRPATAPRTPGSSRAPRRPGALIADQRMQHGFQPLPHRDIGEGALASRHGQASRPRQRLGARTPARSRAWPNPPAAVSARAISSVSTRTDAPIRPACPPRATCEPIPPVKPILNMLIAFAPCMTARARHARRSWQQRPAPGSPPSNSTATPANAR